MAKLTNSELRSLISETKPGATLDDSKVDPKVAPSSAVTVPDRSALAAKVARYRAALSGSDDAAQLVTAPGRLKDDESQIVNVDLKAPDGTRQRKTAIVSTADRNFLAEQG